MQTLFTQYKHKTEGLNRLAEQIAQRESLFIALRSELSANMQSALVGAEILGDTLILLTPSAAWATRLRFDAQKLLAKASDSSLRHYRIQIVTQSTDIVESQTRHKAEKPNQEDVMALQAISDKLEPNDALKASMTRLLRAIAQGTTKN